MPEPVGAGGIQDNLATSSNVGLNNPDFTGHNLYFALGPQNQSGVIGGITPLLTSDGSSYVYSQTRALSDLYVIRGLK